VHLDAFERGAKEVPDLIIRFNNMVSLVIVPSSTGQGFTS
jgi:hypothetical protein